MTMGKMANKNVLSNQQLVSPNLELMSKNLTFNSETVKKTTNKNSSSQKSLRVFKYFIISTIIVFTFGGLGFGLALRYGYNLEISQSKNLIQNDSFSK